MFGFICWNILSWSPINSSLHTTAFQFMSSCCWCEQLSPSKTLLLWLLMSFLPSKFT